MPSNRRYLVARALNRSRIEEYAAAFAAEQEATMAACPDAAGITDLEAEEFWAAAVFIDSMDRNAIVKGLKRAHIPYPPTLAFDVYRLARHLFRRWNDPALRKALLEHVVNFDAGRLARLRRSGDISTMGPTIELFGAPACLWVLRHYDMSHMVEPLVASFTPEETARYRALLQFGKLTLHRFMTEPEPATAPSPWEQQKLARRIRLREVQLRSMRRSLHKLRRERGALLERLRETGRIDQPELDAMAAELAELRARRAAAAKEHARELADRAESHRQALARLHAELTASEADYQAALARRRTWLPVPRG